MTVTQEANTPPPFEAANVVDLVSENDSKITSLSLYPAQALVTRLFKFSVKTGSNQVNIKGLPSCMDQSTIRVEGRGSATIHDVTTSMNHLIQAPLSMSDALKDLERRKEQVKKALDRANQSLRSLKTYIETLNVQHVEASQLKTVLDNYDSTTRIWDERVSELEKERQDIEEKIKAERERLSGVKEDGKLLSKVSIGLFAECDGPVEIILIYAVTQCHWKAAYDLRVTTDAKESPVKLIYKSIITQSTGEDWENVPLTLETANPTLGASIPTLQPCYVDVERPFHHQAAKSKRLSSRALLVSAAPPMPQAQYEGTVEECDASLAGGAMSAREAHVTSRGSITATFSIPGLITIPTDGTAHNFTIVTLNLDAEMSWIAVPKVNNQVHLKAKVTNASEYTFLSGNAAIYVDGSFIARSTIPLVSPQEEFDCALGLDPSIRITYHPRSKKRSDAGFAFYSKTQTNVFTQQITVHNTKTLPIAHLKIIDQIPISSNADITVKLVSPSLVVGTGSPSSVSSSTLSKSGTAAGSKMPLPLKVQNGVMAQWESADDPEGDPALVGTNGKLYWLCEVPPQGKVNLTLQWEVSAPFKTRIAGL